MLPAARSISSLLITCSTFVRRHFQVHIAVLPGVNLTSKNPGVGLFKSRSQVSCLRSRKIQAPIPHEDSHPVGDEKESAGHDARHQKQDPTHPAHCTLYGFRVAEDPTHKTLAGTTLFSPKGGETQPQHLRCLRLPRPRGPRRPLRAAMHTHPSGCGREEAGLARAHGTHTLEH